MVLALLNGYLSQITLIDPQCTFFFHIQLADNTKGRGEKTQLTLFEVNRFPKIIVASKVISFCGTESQQRPIKETTINLVPRGQTDGRERTHTPLPHHMLSFLHKDMADTHQALKHSTPITYCGILLKASKSFNDSRLFLNLLTAPRTNLRTSGSPSEACKSCPTVLMP